MNDRTVAASVIGGVIGGFFLIIAALITSGHLGGGRQDALLPPAPTVGVSSQEAASVDPAPTVTPDPTSTPGPTLTPDPTPTPLPVAGAVLYEADTSNGLDDFAASGPWQKFDGMLASDGTSGGWTFAPYQPEVLDFAIEVEIELLRGHLCYGGGYPFAIGVPDEVFSGFGGNREDDAGMLLFIDHDPSQSSCWDLSDAIASTLYHPGWDWHTYRLELEGNSVRLLVDDVVLLEDVDNRLLTLSGGRIGIWSGPDSQVNVRSFKVIAM